jgi:hypothetical protein
MRTRVQTKSESARIIGLKYNTPDLGIAEVPALCPGYFSIVELRLELHGLPRKHFQVAARGTLQAVMLSQTLCRKRGKTKRVELITAALGTRDDEFCRCSIFPRRRPFQGRYDPPFYRFDSAHKSKCFVPSVVAVGCSIFLGDV